MLSAPYYPIDDVIPNNIRHRDFGGGRRGVEIDGNGGAEPLGFTQRICLTQGETRSIRSTVLVQSDLVAAANGFEGIGFDVKCLVRDGSSLTPLVTWTNAPFLSGDPSKLTTEQFADWTVITEVVQVPADVAVEFIDCTWAVRGSSGQCRFVSASLRNHYQSIYTTYAGDATWTDFDRQLIPIGDTGHQIYAEIHYLDAYAVSIPKNSEMTLSAETYIDHFYYRDYAGSAIPIICMVGLKMRRRDGGYDFYGHRLGSAEGTSDTELRGVPVDIKPVFYASEAYTQVEPIIYTLPDQSRTDYAVRSFEHRGISIKLLINDSVASSSE